MPNPFGLFASLLLSLSMSCAVCAQESAPTETAAPMSAGSSAQPPESEDAPPSDSPPTTEENQVARPARRPNPAQPELTPEKRVVWAAELRRAYAEPPERWPHPQVDSTVRWREIGPLPAVKHPEENPFSVEKAQLGAQLFFDPRLSGSGQIACASCHDPEMGWTDGRSTSFGHNRQQLARNAPSLLNLGHAGKMFWDGRAESLEDQARQVLLNRAEMHSSAEHLQERLGRLPEYRTQFAAVFGGDGRQIGIEQVCQALATFERTIVGGRSPFDRFLAGQQAAMSDSAVIGLHLFRTQARCMNCHHGPNFTDNDFHDLGLSFYGRSKYEDLGRYEITGKAADVGRFKTPTLRNVARTRPLMHNGLFELTGVLNMYNAGMPTLRRKPEQEEDPLFPTKSPLLSPLHLNRQQLGDLAEFLTTLSEPRRRFPVPTLPAE